MSKAGHFARPTEVDGKHHPEATCKEEQEPSRWSDTVHKVADTVRGWLPVAETPKDG